ncbi:MAG: Lrp/AsnC family transcriptional regulator [Candidatus Bathyarchaeota archaeon]|nr:Lrp/AsnC family transcriptional regulator [Candidatus Bathyarchaeota archaeon]MDH5494347.1 Lrp/AsnC family transcriptional regulator [Candidatus Bathyarchaeota archaeon]
MHPDKIPKLLYELIKNSRRSDRDLAKVLGFSQPTVTRTRRKLEDEKYVLQYTALPDFTKLGFELAAFTFVQWLPEEKTETTSPYKWLDKEPRVIFVADGNGMGKNSLIVTMHKNYTDYSDFIADLRQKSKIANSNSFITTLTNIKKHMALAGLQKV